MNRRRADIAAAVLVGSVLLIGGALSWQAYRQRRILDSSMMGGSMTTMHGPNPLWYVLGTVLLAAVVAVLYLAVRADLPSADDSEGGESTADDGAREVSSADGIPGSDSPTDVSGRESSATTAGGEPEPAAAEQGASESESAAINPEAQPQARVLDLLPDDERRVLEPVLSSPGITQIELRDRSGFSKSKVSQTVSGLESRGLLYRERQGRTYRVYPSEGLQDADR